MCSLNANFLALCNVRNINEWNWYFQKYIEANKYDTKYSFERKTGEKYSSVEFELRFPFIILSFKDPKQTKQPQQ